MDLGCGTGLVGEHLYKEGFRKIHGIDASQGMIDQAEQKDVYSHLEKFKLCQEEFYDSIPIYFRNDYDFVTAAGLLSNHYMDEKLLDQMLIFLKPGGHIILACEFSYLGEYWYNLAIEQLEEAKRIKLVESEDFFKYTNLPQAIGKFSKSPCRVYVFRKVEQNTAMTSGRL